MNIDRDRVDLAAHVCRGERVEPCEFHRRHAVGDRRAADELPAVSVQLDVLLLRGCGS
jgi:hypothetical protein